MRSFRLMRSASLHLKQTFHLDAWRPGQKAAAYTLLSGRDLLCVLPTGAGKSLCWQLPAVVHDGLTVVISPLIALMADQVRHLNERGIPAVTLNSLMSPEERRAALNALAGGTTRIVFVAPERLKNPAFLQLCQTCSPWLLVVDEAHCVVQWGAEFRPAYGQIAAFASALPGRPVVCALTATADAKMQHAVMENLQLLHPKRIRLPVIRENLAYEVRTTLDKTGEILNICRKQPCRTVIFCRSRRRTESLASILKSYGINAGYYHAGLDRERRDSVQTRFQQGRIDVLTATTAFGMGVDIPDIRRVIHDYLPDDLTDYVQQSGRAGRDRKNAECVLLIEPNELMRRCGSIRREWKSCRSPIAKICFHRETWKPLKQLLQAMLAESCIPAAISRAFGKKAKPCGRCSACLRGPMVRRAPDLPRMNPEDVTAFFLRWQRSAIARKLNQPERKVLPQRALTYAARRLILPENEGISAANFERLLAHFRHDDPYKSDADRAE